MQRNPEEAPALMLPRPPEAHAFGPRAALLPEVQLIWKPLAQTYAEYSSEAALLPTSLL